MTTFSDQWHSDKCLTCKHSASDPDGAYCGHPESLRVSGGYGQGITLARSIQGVCKPNAQLYEKCACKDAHCPRHQREVVHG